MLPVIETDWVYDVAFLGLAVVPLAAIAYHIRHIVHPLAALVTASLLGDGHTHPQTHGESNQAQ